MEARFEVASKEAGLGLEVRNTELLVLVYVSDGALMICGGSVDPDQLSDTTGQEEQWRHTLSCTERFCLLEGKKASVLPGYDYFWIWIACEVFILLADVRLCEWLVVS